MFSLVREVEQQKAYQAENPDAERIRYAPALVCCPGASVEVWMADAEKFYPRQLHVFQWYGSLSSVHDPARQKQLINRKIEDLNQFLAELDPFDPKVCSYIV
jgi:hypothetical protein